MSRTKKGTKAPGYEYWGKRPGNRCGAVPSKFTKTMTHRIERREGKRVNQLKPEDCEE